MAANSIESVISKLTADTEKKAAEILAQANAEAARITARNKDETARETEAILKAAEEEAKAAGEIVASGIKISKRDAAIKDRQEGISRVKDKAAEKLRNLSDDEYIGFVCANIKKSGADGSEQLLLAGKYAQCLQGVNDRLKGMSLPELSGYTGDQKIEDGFKLVKSNMESDFSAVSLIRDNQYQIEKIIIQSLFATG